MNFEFYPDDITTALINCTDQQYTPEQVKEFEEALYNLKAICENPYNSDFYRTFYKLLEAVTNCHIYDK